MIGRTNTGGGGGGTGLNFRVIGSTIQPTSAKENDIWVNTSTQIESWIFSAIEPESPVTGMVWLEVGTASAVAFNMIKKNAVYIYPVSCKQYVGEDWLNVEAHIYQGGAWVQFSEIVTDVYLFNNGDTFDSVTGGWSKIGSGQVREGDLSLYVYHSVNGAQVYANNAIDLTTFSKLRVLLSSSGVDISVGVMSSAPSTDSNSFTTNRDKCVSKMTIAKGTLFQELDISSLNGLYYVWAGRAGSSSVTDNGAYITEVILMK